MNNFYSQIHLNPSTSYKIFSMIGEINKFVNSRFPMTSTGNYWRVTSLTDQNIISFIDFEEHKDSHTILEISWDEICQEFPYLIDFIDKFGLENYYGTINSGNWGVHKHVFSPISKWNMLFLGPNTENSTISFHKTIKDFGPVTDNYVYDHLPNDYPSEIVESFTVRPGDIYTLNVWEWHSFTVPNNVKVEANLFYFKNSQYLSDIEKIIQRIELHE